MRDATAQTFGSDRLRYTFSLSLARWRDHLLPMGDVPHALHGLLDAATLGNDGSFFFSAIIYLLRRDALPPTARPPDATASQQVMIPAFQLRCRAALHLQTAVLPRLPDAWSIVSQQLRDYTAEGGPPPTSLATYVEALHRSDRWADALHVQAVADVLSRALVFYRPDAAAANANPDYPLPSRWTPIRTTTT